MHKKTKDNVTLIIIAFENFKKNLFNDEFSKVNQLQNVKKNINNLNGHFKIKEFKKNEDNFTKPNNKKETELNYYNSFDLNNDSEKVERKSNDLV